MYDEILFPIDGSASLDAVYPHAADAAARHGATVHVLYVVDDRAFLTLADEMQDDVIGEFRAEGEAALDWAQRRFADDGVDVVTELRRGSPAEEILTYAEAAGVDLVTMGTHGPDSQETVVGSVSETVVKSSPVPVLTVRLP
ncbi:MAG: universal stress protein [Haloarculaceae archaeon]